MTKNGKAKTGSGRRRDLQARLRGSDMLEKFLRHLGTISIDLDEEEVEIEATFPDDSYGFGSGNYEVSRTLDLADHDELRDAVRRVVELCQDAVMEPDEEYDADRCDRCVKSDCCSIDRIHLTEDERVAILAHLGVEDTPANSARHFELDDDLAGYYQHIMAHTDGHCSFLEESDGQMRCGIYEVRPQVCREYDAGYCTEYTKLMPKKRATLHV